MRYQLTCWPCELGSQYYQEAFPPMWWILCHDGPGAPGEVGEAAAVAHIDQEDCLLSGIGREFCHPHIDLFLGSARDLVNASCVPSRRSEDT